MAQPPRAVGRSRSRPGALPTGVASALADGAEGVTLIAMHFAVGAVLIAGFSRLIPRTC